MPRRHSMIQQGGGWIASRAFHPDEGVEVKAKVVDAPAKPAPKKTAGAKTK